MNATGRCVGKRKGENTKMYALLSDKVYDTIEKYFDEFIKYVVLLIELVGTIILIYAVVSAVIGLFKHHKHVRLKLAEGIALALEFKIGGELLRTVVARNLDELLLLGVIIVLRAALTFLIQWEIKIERKNGALTEEEIHDIKTPLTQDIEQEKPKRTKKKKSDDIENQ